MQFRACKVLVLNSHCDVMFQDLQNALEGSGSSLTLTIAMGLVIKRVEPLSLDILDLSMTVSGVESITVIFYDINSNVLDYQNVSTIGFSCGNI